MSKLSNFSNEPLIIVEQGVELKVHQLLAREQHLIEAISKADNEDEKIKAFNKVVKRSLRDEQVTDEELNNMTLRVQNLLIDAIMEVNGYAEKFKNAQTKNIIRKDKTPRES